MCGIAGFFKNNKNISYEYACTITKKMSDSLFHRGPDDLNQWASLENDIFFAHSRLSILDLSNKGSQPMISHSGRFVISYNGEIYNHLDIRSKIESEKEVLWKSTCDTETLLEAIELFGMDMALNLIEGMFAFALWDNKNKKLFLVRDKFGQKPLYYGFIGQSLVFGSELKAIKQFPDFNNNISKKSISFYLDYSCIHDPLSIYDDVFKLKASHYLVFDLENNDLNKNFNIKKTFKNICWYNHINQPIIENKLLNEKKLISDLEKKLYKSVEQTMISDVPLGCFLSGGIDSSLISAISQNISEKKIETFSIGFNENEYDETLYARKVSKLLGTDHNECIIDTEKLFSIFDKIIDVYDEPFADSSQIPTILLSEFARSKVKVALTGDGADELFGGYNRYIYTNKVSSYIRLLPLSLRKKFSRYFLSSSTSVYFFSKLFNLINFNENKLPQIKDKIEKFSRIFANCNSNLEIFLTLLKVNRNELENVSYYNSDIRSLFEEDVLNLLNDKNITDEHKMMKIDQIFYLNSDILHKVDRASMSVGLETRVPFLSSDVYEYSRSLPNKYKFNRSLGKWILRRLSEKYFPKEIFSRKKMGFSIPLRKWITLNERKIKNNILKNQNILTEYGLDVTLINKYLNEHIIQKRDWSNYLWNIIILERWLNKNLS